LAFRQDPGERLVRGQVQIGEEEHPRPEAVVLLGQRFLDLEHHLCGIGLLGGGDDASAALRILLVRKAAAQPGTALDDHLVARPHERLDASQMERDPILLVLYLLRDADDHGLVLL